MITKSILFLIGSSLSLFNKISASSNLNLDQRKNGNDLTIEVEAEKESELAVGDGQLKMAYNSENLEFENKNFGSLGTESIMNFDYIFNDGKYALKSLHGKGKGKERERERERERENLNRENSRRRPGNVVRQQEVVRTNRPREENRNREHEDGITITGPITRKPITFPVPKN